MPTGKRKSSTMPSWVTCNSDASEKMGLAQPCRCSPHLRDVLTALDARQMSAMVALMVTEREAQGII